ADVLGDPDRAPDRHADARPEPAGAGAAQRHLQRGSARQSRQQGQLRGVTVEREQATKFIYDLLSALGGTKSSDLFITAGFPPAMKVDGKMTPVSQQALNAQHTSMLCRAVMKEKPAAGFEAKKEGD